jgi:hypothetical protein
LAKKTPFLSNAAVDLYHRVSWPDWWLEFVTTLNRYGAVQYINADQFVKAKAKTPSDAALLIAMIGPGVDEGLETRARKLGLGFVGNWQARRQTVWNSSVLLRELLRELKQGEVSEFLQRLRSSVSKGLARADRLAHRIDSAYAGQPYLPQLAPTAPRNRVRVRHYMWDLRIAQQLLNRAIDAWMKLAFIGAAAAGEVTWNGVPFITQDGLQFAREITEQQGHRWTNLDD